MKKKLVHSWAQTEETRNSMPNVICNNFYYLYDDKNDSTSSFTQMINRRLLRYKELRYISGKTSIPPFVFFYCLVIALLCIIVGFFDSLLSSLIGTAYPLYNSIKALQGKYISERNPDGKSFYKKEDNDKAIRIWLIYWVVYAFFINFESVFGGLLKRMPFYFFIKMLFLLVCFLPNYQLAKWLYDNAIKWLFKRYEKKIEEMFENIIKSATGKNLGDTHVKEITLMSKSSSKWNWMNENKRYESVESDTVYDNPFTPLTKDSFLTKSYDNENDKAVSTE